MRQLGLEVIDVQLALFWNSFGITAFTRGINSPSALLFVLLII